MKTPSPSARNMSALGLAPAGEWLPASYWLTGRVLLLLFPSIIELEFSGCLHLFR